MKLPIPFIKGKKSENAYYLALLLDDERTSSVILEEELGKVKIVGRNEEHLPSSLESISQDELITIVDRTISRAEEVLPPNIETHKTVFGVKENWIDKETKKIKKEYLTKLKKVCDALDLSPIGFMVISEAIANLIQSDEGAPLSSILVELGRKSVHLTLFRGGQITESVSGHLEHSPQTTVDTLLKKFTAPVLPARIILVHTKGAKDLAQQFIHHEWSKSLPFLHVPQVTVLHEDFDQRAVAHGAAQQMGLELVGINKALSDTNPEIAHEIPSEKDDIPTIATPDVVPPAGDNFGFVADQDITNVVPEKVHLEPIHHHTPVTHETAEKEISHKPEHVAPHHVALKHEEPQGAHEEKDNFPARTRSNKKTNPFVGIIASAKSIKMPKNIKVPEFLKKNKGIKLGLVLLGGLLLLGLGITTFYSNNVNAEVVLSVKPKEVSQTENITFSTSSENDFSKNIIAAKTVSVEVEGEVTTPATGKKDTGDKAKGTVTLFNSANKETTISSGSTITASNNVAFTLDKDVKVASASGDIFTGTKPGTAQVAVTAKEIGTDANLPSNTRFAVGGNSSLAAKNDNAFSGGTKKTITVVSRNDYTKLRSELPKSLEKKAIDALSAKNGSSETVLPGFVKSSITEEDFDKDLDSEAKQVKLKATVKFDGMSYQNSDLENFDKTVLKDDYSEDISFADGSLKNEVHNTKVRNEKEIQATLSIVAGLLPKIDSTEVANKLKDKSAGEAKEILGTLPQVSESKIKYTPNIFFLSSLFPTLPKNIKVTVLIE